jgi:hypothetical protein
MFYPVISLGRLFSLFYLRLSQLKTINLWSEGVGFSFSITHESNNLISVVVNVRSMIDLFLIRFGLVIIPGSLLKIRSNLFIIASRDVVSVDWVIRGFHIGL